MNRWCREADARRARDRTRARSSPCTSADDIAPVTIAWVRLQRLERPAESMLKKVVEGLRPVVARAEPRPRLRSPCWKDGGAPASFRTRLSRGRPSGRPINRRPGLFKGFVNTLLEVDSDCRMARYWREVWADAVAKLPPSWSTQAPDTLDGNDALTAEPITAGAATDA